MQNAEDASNSAFSIQHSAFPDRALILHAFRVD
jgi:hypothetical protein